MPLGPVFRAELRRAARRPRTFVLRAAVASLLLVGLWQNYEQDLSARLSIAEAARIALGTFRWIAVAQYVVVLALTPALVAGAVAEESQRRTLVYLLASRLGSGEIVLGKLGARLLQLASLVAACLPVVSLLTLLGGVPPDLVALAFAATLATALFLAGLSMFVSVHARSPGEAILVTYLLEGVWLFLPPLVEVNFATSWPSAVAWLRPAYAWLLAANPMGVVVASWSGVGPLAGRWEAVGWFVGLQLLLAVGFVGLSAWRLRPVAARRAEGRRRGRLRWPRLRRRPPVGEAPMLWKELHVGRATMLSRWVGRFVAVLAVAALAYPTLNLAADALAELARFGFGNHEWDDARQAFNYYLRSVTAGLYIVAMLGIAGSAAGGITGEREADTWTSLMATTLTDGEIVLAKMAGALWSGRFLLGILLSHWMLGVVVGSVHPLGLLTVLAELAVYAWFAAALGTYASLRLATTVKATSVTIAVLALLNGGYLFCCFPAIPEAPVVIAGCSPMVLTLSLVSYAEVSRAFAPGKGPVAEVAGWVVLLILVSISLYAFLAIVLTNQAEEDFAEAIDRPRRTGPRSGPSRRIPDESPDSGEPDDAIRWL